MSGPAKGTRLTSSVTAENEEISLHLVKRLIEKLQASFDAHQKDMERRLDAHEKSLKKAKSSVTKKIETERKTLQDYIDTELGRLTSRMTDIEDKVKKLEEKQSESEKFNPEVTIIASKLPYSADEDLNKKAHDLISKGLRLHNPGIVRTHRLESKGPHPGLVKIQLSSLDEKKRVLQAKLNLQQDDQYKMVFLRSSKTHAERIHEMNVRTLLNIIPQGNSFRLTGNGKLVRKQNAQASAPSHHAGQRNQTENLSNGLDYSYSASPWLRPPYSTPPLPYQQDPTTY